ncbi:unnamed protein product, partial [Linum tenue]
FQLPAYSELQNLRYLEELDLSNPSNVSDSSLETIFGKMPSLKNLVLKVAAYKVTSRTDYEFRNLEARNNYITGVYAKDEKYSPNSSVSEFQLRTLDLSSSQSHVPGQPFPNFLYHQRHLQFLDLSHDSFRGKGLSQLYQGTILFYISGINLSNNSLTGEIPPEFGNFTNIKVLNLSHNFLSGSIPSTFSNLKQIESLDLSYNKLNGTIPNNLVELNFLADFSVAHNNLSGKTLGNVAQFGTFDESSHQGNDLLCGWPLPKKLLPHKRG